LRAVQETFARLLPLVDPEAEVSAGEDALPGAVSVAFLLVATRPVVERTADSQTWESFGQREIRGVSEPLEVLRLVSPAG
jgi:hypothetical protein